MVQPSRCRAWRHAWLKVPTFPASQMDSAISTKPGSIGMRW
nr:hypothetical protein [Burkholderia plantarii]